MTQGALVVGSVPSSADYVHVLSLLTLACRSDAGQRALSFVAALDAAERADFLRHGELHHVLVRPLITVQQCAMLAGETAVASWATTAIARERGRIERAISALDEVCHGLTAAGFATTVIKTLDHWPDLGNDLDLFIAGDGRAVAYTMVSKFKARMKARTWRDRLAHRWVFSLPGLRQPIEIQCQRLGQAGEHADVARRFVARRIFRCLDGYTFPAPAPEERVIIATMERLYRHFYLRVSDIVNTAALLEDRALDFAELRRGADLGGIWPGVATYLKLVADYTTRYRGRAPELPEEVERAAILDGQSLIIKDRFIQVPVLPYAARLYASQATRTMLRGDLSAAFRLTLLPALAAVTALAGSLNGRTREILVRAAGDGCPR